VISTKKKITRTYPSLRPILNEKVMRQFEGIGMRGISGLSDKKRNLFQREGILVGKNEFMSVLARKSLRAYWRLRDCLVNP
jgi:hypothetical protein